MNVINYVNGIPIVATGSYFNPSNVWMSGVMVPSQIEEVENKDPLLSNRVELTVPTTE